MSCDHGPLCPCLECFPIARRHVALFGPHVRPSISEMRRLAEVSNPFNRIEDREEQLQRTMQKRA